MKRSFWASPTIEPEISSEADVAAVGPALLGDALGLADVELEDFVTVLALQTAGDLAGQEGEEARLKSTMRRSVSTMK